MERSIHRTLLVVDNPTPSFRSPLMSLIYLSLLGPLYTLTFNTPPAYAVLLLTIAIWYLASHTLDRIITADYYYDVVVYTVFACVSASLVTVIFDNIWVRSIGAHVIMFLLMNLYVWYLEAKEEAARMKQTRDMQVAKYLGEPVQAKKTILGDSSKDGVNLTALKDLKKDADIPKARKGPSTRRRV